MTTVKVVRNDKNYKLPFTIFDGDGDPVDLTDALEGTVNLNFKKYLNGDTFSVPGEIVAGFADKGRVDFNVTEEFSDVIGECKAEIKIMYIKDDKETVLTAPNLTVKVVYNLE